jgi:hypothetical protein
MTELFQKQAKDKVTGFAGMIIGLCKYTTGCTQYFLQPQIKDGVWVEGKWFDDNRLEIEGERLKERLERYNTELNPGCDITPPTK